MSSIPATAKVLFEYIAQQDDELTIRMGDIITNVQQEEGGWWKGEVNGKSGMFPENFVSIVKSPSSADVIPPSTFKAEVKFDYEPEQDDEIALLKGTIIDVIATPDEGWWKGRYEGKEGLFPSNFVVVAEAASKPSDPPIKPVPIPDAEHAKQPEMETKPQPPKGASKIANLLGMIRPEDLSRNNLKKVKSTDKQDEGVVELVAEGSGIPNDGILKPTQLVPPMHVDNEKEKKKMPSKPAGAGAMKDAKPVQYAMALYDYDPELPDELELKVGDKITVIDSELTFEGWMRGEVNGKVGIFPDNFVELMPTEGAERPGNEGPKQGKKEELVPRPAQPAKESAPKPKQVVMMPGVPMMPPGGPMLPERNPLQNELAEKFSKIPSAAAPPPPKVAAKAPPPVPSSKPLLPSTKPKPQVPPSKPPIKLPFMAKPDKQPGSPSDTRPLKDDIKTPSPKTEPKLPGNILKPVPVKNEIKSPLGNTLPDASGDMKKNIPIENRSSSMDELKSVNLNVDDIQQIQKSSSVSIREKPPRIDSEIRSRSFGEQESSKLFNNKFPLPSTYSQDKEENGISDDHTKVKGRLSVQLDDIKPTDPLKHIERVKPPSKSPPSKFNKDKHPLEEFNTPSVDNSKEVNELKQQVVQLEHKIEDMAEMFKNFVIQSTEELSTERKLRSNLQIEVETLNKKLKLFLDKPGLPGWRENDTSFL